jgi:hypothetical protein
MLDQVWGRLWPRWPGGPEWTREDGDLRRYTWVDGLPLDGMQEVWGSNHHSSTGQKQNSKTRAESTAGKYRNGQSPEVPHVYLDRASFRLILLVGPEDPRVMDGSRRAAELGKCSALQSLDSCRTVTPTVLARQFRH